MPLLNVFIGMTIICLSVATLYTLWGWGCFIRKNSPGAERAFTSARAALTNCGIFGAVALFGLLFI